eukprot:5585254-Alexandrium_andersonii.AAC.1
MEPSAQIAPLIWPSFTGNLFKGSISKHIWHKRMPEGSLACDLPEPREPPEITEHASAPRGRGELRSSSMAWSSSPSRPSSSLISEPSTSSSLSSLSPASPASE